jgi:type I restriction enzyme S subunit
MTDERVPVGEVLQLERRPLEPDPTREYISIGIRSFGRGIFHYEPATGDRLGKLRFFEVVPDRLVLSNIKGWEGAIAVSTESEAGCIASNRFLTYAPIDDRIDVGWARWYFLSDAGLKRIQQASPGSADRNRTLAIARFEALEIPLPPLDEQRRVAGRLDSLEAVTAEFRRHSEHASTVAEALAVSIAARPDLDDEDKEARGWRRVRLESAMQPAIERVTVQATQSYPNVGVYSFGRGLFEKPEIKGASTSATTLNRIKAGQFTYSRLFAFEGAYTYVPPQFDGYYVSNEFPAFDTDPKQLDAHWLAAYLASRDRWADLAGRSKGLGVRRQRVPMTAVMNYEVWLPPIATQRAMVGTIDSLDRARGPMKGADKRFDALLPAALNEAFASSVDDARRSGLGHDTW